LSVESQSVWKQSDDGVPNSVRYMHEDRNKSIGNRVIRFTSMK